MDRKNFLRLAGLLLSVPVTGCVPGPGKKQEADDASADRFTFAFLTDVHLSRDNRGDGENGLRQALADVCRRKADFVIFGGDNVETDHLKDDERTADALHARFKSIVSEYPLTAYFTIGNHDRFYRRDGAADKTGYKLFEKHFGSTSYSFTYRGVHFIVLNSLNPDGNGGYCIGAEQMEWLKNDLKTIGEETPVVVSLHVPMLSLYYPVVEGTFKGADMISDTKPVFDLLNRYKLELVLQGHQHLHEEIRERNRRFVTGGAVSAYWWGGPFLETEEGYLLVHVGRNRRFSWEYIDYGWHANITTKE